MQLIWVNCWAVNFTNSPSLNELAHCAVLWHPNAWWTKVQTRDWGSLLSEPDASVSLTTNYVVTPSQRQRPTTGTKTRSFKSHKVTNVKVFTFNNRTPNLGHKLFVHAPWTKPTLGTSSNYSSLKKTKLQLRAQQTLLFVFPSFCFKFKLAKELCYAICVKELICHLC
jgi:hypothetical protein